MARQPKGRARALGAAAHWLLLSLLFGFAWPAMGQDLSGRGTNSPNTAPTIDRDRADRLVPSIPQLAVPAPAAPPPTVATAPAGEMDILLTAVRYDGASLPTASLDAVVAPWLGRPLTQDVLQAIANAISLAYVKSDIAFHAVSIPAQTPTGGVLTVKVVEGRVTDYTLVNASPSTPKRLIRAHMRRLMRDAPLRRSTLERTLSLLRDVPGQTVDAEVRQLDTSGNLVLDLSVKRKQLQGGLLIDNSGVSNVVEGVQAQLSVAINGLAREGDSLRVAGYLPFYPDRYQFYSASYATPLGSDGLSLGASLATVRSRSTGDQIKGQATLAGLTMAYPLVRSYKTNISLSLSLDGIDSSNYYLDTKFGDYRSRAVRLGGSVSKTDGDKGFAVSAIVSQGVDLFNAKAFEGFSSKSFTKANIQAVGVMTVKKIMTVKTTVRGQYSRDKLPVTERMSLGGRDAGMAFPVGAVTAEKAVAGSIELDWKLPTVTPLVKNSSLFVYVDGARGRTVARPAYALPAETVSLASVGGGLRFGVGKGWTASTEVAVPIERPSAAYSNKPRFFFGLARAI
ncbi:MAG TPA: ShlB/FhaC/HecB family hemolysin secretion/activation protein [Sphingobium sp.]|nr:ShlB/FhaC/HecB family hemolysin secretion/activation protein [Sphingobium sp.]